MRVTQAGKGGMEWLAGGRMPSWSSPYSAQATAALKAQFPTKWPTIAKYGFAHPEIVGYMNAYAPEDAKIAYSLVPTLGVIRWCAGDGSYGFSTGYIPEGYDHEFFTRFKLLASGQQGKGVWGKGDYSHQITNAVYLTSWFSGSYPNLMMWGWQGQHGGWRGDTSGSKYDYVWDVKMSFSQSKVNLDILRDGEPNQNSDYTTVVNFANDNIPLYLFKGSAFGNCKCAISEHYDKVNGVYKEYFVPYIKNGVGGMLNMVSGEFFGHSSFTISETPS